MEMHIPGRRLRRPLYVSRILARCRRWAESNFKLVMVIFPRVGTGVLDLDICIESKSKTTQEANDEWSKSLTTGVVVQHESIVRSIRDTE